MHHEYLLGLGREGIDPVDEAVLIRVAALASQHINAGVDLNRLAEQLDLLGAVHQTAAQRAVALIAHKQHGAFLAPQVVLQVVTDAAGIAHAAGGDDHLGLLVHIQGLGIVRGDRQAQVGAGDGVDALLEQLQGFLIGALVGVLLEHIGGFHGQGAVHVHREVVVALDEAVLLDVADEVQKLLGAAHRKAGDDHVTALIQRGLDDLRQVADIIRRGAVGAVAVGGFHDHIVGPVHGDGIPQQGLADVADIAGEHENLLSVAFPDGDLDGSGAQQMAHVHHADGDAVEDVHAVVIAAGHELAVNAKGVLLGVEGLHQGLAAALVLAVLVLRVAFLNVGRVQQHDLAQVGGGLGGVHMAPEAVLVQQRQIAAVVDVGVGEQHRVQTSFGDGQGRIFVQVCALFHAVVDHDVLAAGLQQKTAAGDLMGGT